MGREIKMTRRNVVTFVMNNLERKFALLHCLAAFVSHELKKFAWIK